MKTPYTRQDEHILQGELAKLSAKWLSLKDSNTQRIIDLMVETSGKPYNTSNENAPWQEINDRTPVSVLGNTNEIIDQLTHRLDGVETQFVTGKEEQTAGTADILHVKSGLYSQTKTGAGEGGSGDIWASPDWKKVKPDLMLHVVNRIDSVIYIAPAKVWADLYREGGTQAYDGKYMYRPDFFAAGGIVRPMHKLVIQSIAAVYRYR